MGYALMFARALYNTARKNQLSYETISIQNRKTDITNKLTDIQKLADSLPADSPNLQSLQMHKQMLVMMSNNLDLRLKSVQTQINQITAEEQSVNESLDAQIKASAPKYVGR